MDEEGLRLDVAEALGKASAAIAIQSAIIGLLVEKRVLDNGDAATLAGLAIEVINRIGLPDDVRMLAESAVRGYSKTWTTRVTRN